MRSQRFLLTPFLVLLSIVAFSSADAQTARRNFTRPQTYDVEHYIIRASFDRTAKKVIGDTTIRFRPLKNRLAIADFDAVGITFNSVALEPAGTPLKFRTATGKIFVTLDKTYSSDDAITIRFKHTSVPRKGVYFVEQGIEDGKVIHSSQIWTQGEADEARHWFPSFDFPSDRATTEQYLTASADEVVVGNGEAVGKTANSDGTATWHFRMDVPIPTYLVSFVIGKYAKVEEKYRDIPLGYYVYPGTESITSIAYKNTKEMMRFFEEVTRIDYPFNKYDQTVVSSFPYGGMENVTATTMGDTDIYSAPNPLFTAGVEDLVSHELAHSWFGNMVTCKNWAELWLNEGFATFMEAAFRERMYGRRNYMVKIMRDAETFITDDAVNNNRNALFNENADRVSELFERPATVYNKGGAVLHTLREEIGNEAFWKGVNIYLTAHRFGNVESADLLRAMEQASGRDLDWFFDQWVYKGGHPKLSVRQAWNEQTKTLRLTVTQTQRPDRITPAAFRLPMEIAFTLNGEKQNEKISVTRRLQTFSYKLPGRPTAIDIDPEEKIPVKTVKGPASEE
ncbi:MAG TPA: M1 family aminopeptidase [Pyrinomonadaceae bacterium]|nr:M1 family aminopeptidase [Pyrinomonadaceae bacterium]